MSTIVIFEVWWQANSEERITSVLQVFTGLIYKNFRLLRGTLLKLLFQIELPFQKAGLFVCRMFAAFFYQKSTWKNVKLLDINYI